jgi:glucose/arabinose dehydrogenase
LPISARNASGSLVHAVIVRLTALRAAAPVFLAAFALLDSASTAVAFERAPWDGGQVPVNPSPGRYSLSKAFPGLDATFSIGAVAPPGETNRIILFGQGGTAVEVAPLDRPVSRVFLDLGQQVFLEAEAGLLGMAFHPGFQTNGFIFVYHTRKTSVAGMAGFEQRLSRFQVPAGGDGRPDPASETVLFSQADANPTHNGGGLMFGPDGYLYVSVGDGSLGEDRVTQRIDRGFFGGILRLDVDKRAGNPAPNPGEGVQSGSYSIPADNPFIGATRYELGGREVWSGLEPSSLRTEFYAIGMRNPWQFSFDPLNGDLWANDVGLFLREEINRVVPGGNYGWPWREGNLDWSWAFPDAPPTTRPVFDYTHESGRSAVTGSRFYRGALYPDLDGSYLFADLSGDIGSIRTQTNDIATVEWIASEWNIAAFGADPRDGALLVMPTADGHVRRLDRKTAEGDAWPNRLSELGVFSDLPTRTPNPGLVAYEVNSPFWSDEAEKFRWFGLPGLQSRIGFQRDEPWSFPVGTVWVKHFNRPDRKPPLSPLPLETRILVMTTNGVSGASYRWREDGSEADLVPATGSFGTYFSFYYDELGNQSIVARSWRFPGRQECLSCHTRTIGGPAGFNTAQLNRKVRDGSRWISQIDLWAEAGYFHQHPEGAGIQPAEVAIDDTSAPIERRVRSYLASNCSQCHRPGGVLRAQWDARSSIPLDAMGIIGVTESVPIGSLASKLVTPGDLSQSMLYKRIAEPGVAHMPPLGSFLLNTNAISVVAEWITNDLPNRVIFDVWVKRSLPGSDPDTRARNSDPDADGLSNYEEYLLGEDPLDPVRRWSVGHRKDSEGVRLVFPKKTGRRFEVEWNDRLDSSGSWSRYPHPSNDPGTAPVDAEAVIPIPTDVDRFYRVRISEE